MNKMKNIINLHNKSFEITKYYSIHSKRKYSKISNLVIQSGVFTKEQQSKTYSLSKFSLKDVKKEKELFWPKLYNIVSLYINDIKKTNKNIYCSNLQIPQKLIKILKKERLKLFHINDILKYNLNIFETNTPKSITLNEKMSQISYNNDSNIFEHPREELNYIIGINTIPHNKKVKNLTKKFSKYTIKELLEEKNRNLSEILKITHSKTNKADYKYSNMEIKKLKFFAQKFDAIDYLLEINNINTRAIDTVLNSSMNSNYEYADCLPNGDIIINFSKIYDNTERKTFPIIVGINNTDKGYRLKCYIYNIDLIQNINNYRKKYKFLIKNNNIEGILNLNHKLSKYIKDSEVSEVYLENITGSVLLEKMRESNFLEGQNLIENKNEMVYYIKDLKNFNTHKYSNASLILIKCLKNIAKINTIKKAYLEALAFNNIKHSPAALYLKSGAFPISMTTEELKYKILKKELDYQENIWFLYNI